MIKTYCKRCNNILFDDHRKYCESCKEEGMFQEVFDFMKDHRYTDEEELKKLFSEVDFKRYFKWFIEYQRKKESLLVNRLKEINKCLKEKGLDEMTFN